MIIYRKFISLIYKLIKKVELYFTKLIIQRNIKMKSKNGLSTFEDKIKLKWIKSNPQFGEITKFYQTHPQINVPGVRPTLSRINNYQLLDFLDKNYYVLDVGGNVSMFSSYISTFVKHIDVVEYNTKLSEIGTDIIKHLNIENVQIHNIDFKKFDLNKKYDIIFSFAIHRWVGESLDNYLNRLMFYLKPDGKILIESHPNEDVKELKTFLSKSKNVKIIKEGITDDHLGKIRGFFYITKRH